MQETDQLLKRHAQEADRRFRELDELFEHHQPAGLQTARTSCGPAGSR